MKKKKKPSAEKEALGKVLRSTGILLPESDDEIEAFNKLYGKEPKAPLPEKLKFENMFPECGGAKCKIKNCLVCKNEMY